MKRVFGVVMLFSLMPPAFAMKSNHNGWHGNAPVKHGVKPGAKSKGRA